MVPDGRTDGRTDDAKTISLRLRRGITMIMLYEQCYPIEIMRRSRQFCQRGTNSTLTGDFFPFLLVDEGREDPNTMKSRSSSAN